MSLTKEKRLRISLCAAFFHLLASIVIISIIAATIFTLWFPEELKEITGGKELFLIILSVDIVCGPILTLIIFNPSKKYKELRKDLISIAIIQLIALSYGIYTLSQIKPIALIYEVDRFRVVSISDLDENETASNISWTRVFGLSKPQIFGIRSPIDGDEALSSIEHSLRGVEPSQRPSWWQDYKLSLPQVLHRSRPISDLYVKHPEKKKLIDAAASRALSNIQPKESADTQVLRWLPLVSRHATDWVVLLDPSTARVRGYVHLDGF